MLILLGTHDDYIYSVDFDDEHKSLSLLQKTRLTQHPSWLTRHPIHRDIVYSNGHVEGLVFCLKVARDGGITVLDQAKSGGAGPTHLALNHDNTGLLIAHYGQDAAGLLSLLPLKEDGRFAARPTETETETTHHFSPDYPSQQPWSHPRLDAPHVHHVMVHGQNEVIACDLGSNKLWRLTERASGSGSGSDGWDVVGTVEGFEDGDGPRHAVIHPDGHTLYVLNEVSSSLTVHTLPSVGDGDGDGNSKLLSRFSILPPEDIDNGERMTAAEIVLLPPIRAPASASASVSVSSQAQQQPESPSLLLLTNRYSTAPQGDAIALFAVRADGAVERAPEPFYHGVGRHIRALAADASGRYVATAGRDGGGVVVLERSGEHGLDLVEVARLDLPHVVVPVWL